MSEKTIRKLWLSILILTPIFMLFIGVSIPETIPNGPDGVPELLKKTRDQYFGGVLNSIIFALILYLCAYRKPGTKILTISFVFHAFALFACICSIGFLVEMREIFIKTSESDQITSIINKISALMLITLLIDAIYIYLSYKLRKFNKKIQFNQVLAIPGYQIIFHDLQSTTALEDLNQKFVEAVKKHPEIEWHLKKVFKEQKEKCNQELGQQENKL